MRSSTTMPNLANAPGSQRESDSASKAAIRGSSPSRIKDPKLVTGVVLIALSMILGSWIVSSADQRTTVWALKAPLAAGSVLGANDLIPSPVNVESLATYVEADQSLEGMRLTRDLGANELVPAAALTQESEERRLVTIPIGLEHGAAAAARGDKVDVHVSERDAAGGIRSSKMILSEVVIAEVNPSETGNGEIPIVLAVSPAQVPALVGALRGGVLDIVKVEA